MRELVNNSHTPTGNPVAHLLDRYGNDLGPVTGFPVPQQTYAFDSIGKQTRLIQLGRCYFFDGTDDYVFIPDSSVYKLQNVMLSLVFTITTANTGLKIHLGGAMRLGSENTTQYGWTSDAGAASYLTVTPPSKAAGTLVHLVIMFTNTEAKLYCNGVYNTVARSTVTVSGLVTAGLISWGTQGFYVGKNTAGSLAVCNDRIINFQVAPWTASNETALLANPYGMLSGACLFLKCDEQYGLTAYDSSGNSNHGVINNVTQSTFHSTQNFYSWQNEIGYSNAGSIYNEQFNVTAVAASSSSPLTLQGWTLTNSGGAFTATLALSGTALVLAEPAGSTTTNVFLSKTFTIATTGWYRLTAVITNPGTNSNIYWRWSAYITGQVNQQTGTVNCYGYLTAGSQAFQIIPQAFGYQLTIDSIDVTQVSFVPRNEASPLLDVLGSTLTYAGRVKYNALLKQSNGATFSGAQVVAFSAFDPSAYDYEIEMLVKASNATCGLFSIAGDNSGNNTIGLGAFFLSGQLQIKIGGSSPLTYSMSYNGIWLKVKFSRVGTNLACYINDVLIYTGTQTLTYTGTYFAVGRSFLANFSVYANATFAYFRVKNLTSGAYVLNYNFGEGGGGICFDGSTNANHGFINGATIATFWGTKQDYSHPNLANGFTKYTYFNGTSDLRTSTVPDLSGQDWQYDFAFIKTTDYPRGYFSNNGATTTNNVYMHNASSGIAGFQISLKNGSTSTAQSAPYIAPGSHVSGYVKQTGANVYVNLIVNGVQFYSVTIPFNYNLTNTYWYVGNGNPGSQFLGFYDSAKLTVAGVVVFDIDFKNFLGVAAYGMVQTGSMPTGYLPKNAISSIAVSNPPVGRAHNFAETQIDFTGGVASPYSVISGVPSAYTFAGTIRNPVFAQRSTLAERNFIIFSAIQNGVIIPRLNNVTKRTSIVSMLFLTHYISFGSIAAIKTSGITEFVLSFEMIVKTLADSGIICIEWDSSSSPPLNGIQVNRTVTGALTMLINQNGGQNSSTLYTTVGQLLNVVVIGHLVASVFTGEIYVNGVNVYGNALPSPSFSLGGNPTQTVIGVNARYGQYNKDYVRKVQFAPYTAANFATALAGGIMSGNLLYVPLNEEAGTTVLNQGSAGGVGTVTGTFTNPNQWANTAI